MGGIISLIVFAVELASEVASTVVEITASILESTAEAFMGALEVGADALSSAGEAAMNAISSSLDTVADSGDAFEEVLDDAGTDVDEATNAETELKDALKEICNVADDVGTNADKLATAARKGMNEIHSMHKFVKRVHDCGLITAADQTVVDTCKTEFSAYHTAEKTKDHVEDKMKAEAKELGKRLLKKGFHAAMKSLSEEGIGSCVDAVQDENKAATDVDGLVKKLKKKKDFQKTTGKQAHQLDCTVNPSEGTKHLKCPQNTPGGKNAAHHGCSGRRLSEGNATYPMSTKDVYTWDLFDPTPVEMLCGTRGFVNVTNMAEATRCYGDLLASVSVDWSTLPQWSHVEARGCGATLFAGSEDPTDGYCTAVRHGAPTNAKYVANSYGGDRGHYIETVHCTSMEQATRSMLVASTTNRPEFDLMKFVYGQNCTDAGVHRVEVQGASMGLPRVRIGETNPAMGVATLAVASSHLVLFLFSVVLLAPRLLRRSVVASAAAAPRTPGRAVRQETEMARARARA